MSDELKARTKDFAIRIVRLYSALPKTTEAQVIGKQFVRSGTSVGAQYREAQHAKSDADFVSKIEGSLQELEETSYWLELLDEIDVFNWLMEEKTAAHAGTDDAITGDDIGVISEPVTGD